MELVVKLQQEHSLPVMTKSFQWHRYLAPRHWPSWFAIGCVKLLSLLPFSLRMGAGKRVGRLMHWLSADARNKAGRNVRKVFPELTASERDRLVRKSFEHMGYALSETATVWFHPLDSYRHRITLINENSLHKATAKGRGVILVTAHFSALEIAASRVAEQWRLAAMHSDYPGEMDGAFLGFQRRKFLAEQFENSDVRRMVRALEHGTVVYYSPDRAVPRARGGRAFRFFDLPVLCSTAAARMAKLTHAAIVPVLVSRNERGCGVQVCFCEPLPTVTCPDESTRAINTLFEQHIRAQPEQYIWSSNRFKSPY